MGGKRDNSSEGSKCPSPSSHHTHQPSCLQAEGLWDEARVSADCPPVEVQHGHVDEQEQPGTVDEAS